MRLGLALIVGLVAPLLAGCASHHECRQTWVRIAPADRPAELASALLFDPRPAVYDAQEFACRSDWPSTRAFYSPGQVISYNEWTVDYQGRGFGGAPSSYRRAESVRVGVGYK
jgi:hypothetical protein